MAQDLKLGQFWRDTVLGDVLKVLGVSDTALDESHPEILTSYVRLACYPRGETYLGIQEMKASHLNESRYQLVKLGRFKNFWWSRVKFRKP